MLKFNAAPGMDERRVASFSALQRAEIAEMLMCSSTPRRSGRFSALQRAEIAEIHHRRRQTQRGALVSVLFNEPKLLKCRRHRTSEFRFAKVSVLFNEPKLLKSSDRMYQLLIHTSVSVLFNEPKLLKLCVDRGASERTSEFQCSSTSRNC